MLGDSEFMPDFWEKVEKYKKLGLDPLKWVAGCAVKVDLTTVVYPALHKIKPHLKELGVTVNPREDADIFPTPIDGVEFQRRVFDLNNIRVDPEDLSKLNPSRGISLVQVHQRRAESADAFAEVLLNLYEKIGTAKVRFTVGKGHSIITAYPDAEFALFDFANTDRRAKEGWTLANNDTIQVIDPTDDPGSAAQTYVAISNSLNDLVTLGAYENLQVYPVLDAPSEELFGQMQGHMKEFCSRWGIELVPRESVNRGKLLIGATVVGQNTHELPVFAEKLEAGMKVLVSRPLGDLAPINVYLSCLADEEYLKALEKVGFSLREVEDAKNSVIETMKMPNIKIGKIIHKNSPGFGQPFRKDEHIAETGDVSGPGIYIFKELAELAKVDVKLDQIPLIYPDYVRFASNNYLMDNGTAGTNGAVAIVASDDVVERVKSELAKEGYQPEVMGTILGKGEGKVFVGEEVKELIASKNLLDEFIITK